VTLTEGSLPNCRPKGVTAEQIFNESGARETETNFIASLPNEIIFDENSVTFNPPLKNQVSLEQEKEVKSQNFRFSEIRNGLATASTAFFLALILTFVSILLLALIWGKDYRRSLTYFSWGLLGFIIFLPIGLFLFIIPKDQLVRGLHLSESWDWVGGVIISLGISILNPFFWQSVVCIAIAVGILVLFNLFLRNKIKYPSKNS
jgi:hypothetical protein